MKWGNHIVVRYRGKEKLRPDGRKANPWIRRKRHEQEGLSLSPNKGKKGKVIAMQEMG